MNIYFFNSIYCWPPNDSLDQIFAEKYKVKQVFRHYSKMFGGFLFYSMYIYKEIIISYFLNLCFVFKKYSSEWIAKLC